MPSLKKKNDFIGLFNLQHLAYEYARTGARLALIACRENSLREVADRAQEYGSPNVLMIHADVSRVEECKRIVDETMSHFGRCKSKWLGLSIYCVCVFIVVL
jgi:NAD(P)-dependent dehydrogenase (short-subunit alcohol dehydrogenase family)